jgi:hypothetical protein
VGVDASRHNWPTALVSSVQDRMDSDSELHRILFNSDRFEKVMLAARVTLRLRAYFCTQTEVVEQAVCCSQQSQQNTL